MTHEHNHYERTHYEAVLDIRYAKRYLSRQERLFRRFSGLLSFLTLFTGTAAFGAAMSANPKLAGAAGFTIAALTIIDFVLAPGKKAWQCNELYRRYNELDRLSASLDLAALDDRIHTLRDYSAPSIEALRLPAYNDMLRENGRTEHIQPLTRWQRFISLWA